MLTPVRLTLASLDDVAANGGKVSIALGGTNSTSASGARTALGLEIGTQVQAFDADLSAIAAIAPTKGRLLAGDGSNWIALGVGTNTHVLTADSAETSGIKWAAGGGGGGLPAVDTTAIVSGSADATKLLRFEVDGFTASTTRVVTPPNADVVMAGSAAALTSGRVPYATTGGLLTDSANLLFNGTSLDVGANPLKFSTSYSIGQSGSGFVVTNSAADLVDIIFNTSVTGANMRYENRSGQLLDSGLPELQFGSTGTVNGTAIKVNRDRVRIAGRIASTVGLTVMGQPSQSVPLIALTGLSSTTTERRVGGIFGTFAVATDASRTGRVTVTAADSTATDREGVRVESDGTQPLLSFFGATAVAKQAANADTSGATLGDLETEVNQVKQLLRNYGLMA